MLDRALVRVWLAGLALVARIRMSALGLFSIHLLLAFLVRSPDVTDSAGNDHLDLGAEYGEFEG